MTETRTTPPHRVLLVAAFAALYIFWGSTYLAIRIATETMPAWPMIAARHSLAGITLYSLLRLSGTPPPKRAHWTGGVVGGVMLLVIGNGIIAYVSHRMPSSMEYNVIPASE